MRSSRIGVRELAVAALSLALLVVAFLREPISRFDSATFSTADLLQSLPLFQLEPEYVPRNQLLSDPVVEFAPWLDHSRRELAAGRFPLWNPDNGAGVPFFANYQSAVLSPFSFLFYVLDFGVAVLASAFLKCWLTGVFTYLFLRRIALGPIASLFGAIAFAYCGHTALLLAYPHTAVATFLPASLFVAETILSESGELRRRWFAALALTLVTQAYAGHPETLFFCWTFLAAFVALRLVAIARSGDPHRAIRLGVRLLAIGVGAALAAAPQTVPFLEYAGLSTRLENASGPAFLALDSSTWPRYFFPNLLGTIVDAQHFAVSLPPPNYESANLAYPGALVALLALVAWPGAWRRASTALFAFVAIAWVVWAHDVAGIGTWLRAIPGWRIVPPFVSQAPWAFSLSVLAAHAVEAVFEPREPSRVRATAVLALAGVVTAVFWFGARSVMADFVELHAPSESLARTARAHVSSVSATLLAGAACLAIGYWSRSRPWRRVAAAGTALVLLLQNPLLLSGYETACEHRFVRPETASLRALQREVGGARCVFVSKTGLPPHTNMLYGIKLVTAYDALGFAEMDRALGALLHVQGAWQRCLTASPRALELLGIEYVVIDDPGVEASSVDSSGDVRAHWDGAREDLELVQRLEGTSLYRYLPSRGRYWLVSKAYEADDVRTAFALAVARRFDPYEAVVVGPDLPASFERRGEKGPPRTRDDSAPRSPSRSGVVEILREVPGEVRLRIDQPAAQYLSIAQSFYPGWRASIDGDDASLVRANGVFTALDVPAGVHEVVLEYRPNSLSIGLWLGAAGVLIACSTVLLWARAGGRAGALDA